MKNRIKVVKEEQGYVGYLLQDDVVTFTTESFQTAQQASKALTNHISSKQPRPALPSTPFKSPIVQPTTNFVGSAPMPNNQGIRRSCCGRG